MKYKKNKKGKFKIFAILYSLVMLFAVYQAGSMIFNTDVVAVSEWDTTTKPATGITVKTSGNKTTMLVSTPAALDYAIYYAFSSTSTVDLTIELVNSINMSAKYWKPRYINNSKLTKLTIKGNGNTIEGLKFYSGATDSSSSYAGLIGVMSRPLLVENLSLRVSSTKDINSVRNFGALMGATNNKDITINKCSVYGTIESSNIPSEIGGLIGYVNVNGMKSVTNCWSYCTMKLTGKGNSIGGLIGYVDGPIDAFSNCAKFEGDISSTIDSTIGGLIGFSNGNSSINKCFNNAKLTSYGGAVGGLVGKLNKSGATINDCYNNADLSCGNGTVIGGLVGSGSSLTFNRCYHNGELKRAKYSDSLSQDSSYDNKVIGSYVVNADSDPVPSWKINAYDNYFGIQNDGGDTNKIYLGISKLEKGSITITHVNLCGTVATYNSSFCRDTFSAGNINDLNLIKIYLVFNYNSTCHTVGTFRYNINGNTGLTYWDGKGQGASRNQGSEEYSLRKTDSYKLDLKNNSGIVNQINKKKLKELYMSNIHFYINDGKIRMNPGFIYFYKESGKQYQNWTFDSNSAVTVSIPSATITKNGSYVSNTSDITTSTLGSAFATVSGRNGGLPILKDFYWEYN